MRASQFASWTCSGSSLIPYSEVSSGATRIARRVTPSRPAVAIVASRWAYAVPPSRSRSWACTSSGTTTDVRTPPSSSSYTMLGSVLDVLYASLTSPTPSAAASTMVRISPVMRETRVATAMVPAARRMPRLAPGAPSRSSASSSVSSAVRGTGGRAVISWVSSATVTQRLRVAGNGGSGGGGRGRARRRGGGGRGAPGGLGAGGLRVVGGGGGGGGAPLVGGGGGAGSGGWGVPHRGGGR